MTTRVRRSELIAGKMAGMFTLTFLQQVLLIAVGQLLSASTTSTTRPPCC